MLLSGVQTIGGFGSFFNIYLWEYDSGIYLIYVKWEINLPTIASTSVLVK